MLGQFGAAKTKPTKKADKQKSDEDILTRGQFSACKKKQVLVGFEPLT